MTLSAAEVRAIVQEEVQGILRQFERRRDPFADPFGVAAGKVPVNIDALADQIAELQELQDDRADRLPETSFREGVPVPSGTDGDIMYWKTDSGTGIGYWEKLNIGTAAQRLAVNSGADAPEWADPELPEGSEGDILYCDSNGDWVVLAAPSGFTYDPFLRHDGSAPYWEEPESC